MRVLHVTEAAASGTLEVVRVLSARLVAEGHAVALAYGTRPETPADLDAVLPSGLVAFPLLWRRRAVHTHLASARALRRIAASWAPDVVHLHSSFAGLVGAAALRARVPLVYTPHGSIMGRTQAGRLRRAAYARAEGFVGRRVDVVGAVSQSEAALLRRIIAPERVTAVANGISELDRDGDPAPRRGPRPLVVALGRIAPARRPVATARILAALTDLADVAWIGAAAGDEDRPVLEAGVPVTGWLPRSRALEILSRATLLVHWSASDGAPLAVLEAMASDVVVVASDIRANRELVGEQQVRVQEADAIALARAVLTDPALERSLLQRQRVLRADHSGDRMAAAWIELYTGVLDGRRAVVAHDLREPETIG